MKKSWIRGSYRPSRRIWGAGDIVLFVTALETGMMSAMATAIGVVIERATFIIFSGNEDYGY
jgi:hypothetical protein